MWGLGTRSEERRGGSGGEPVDPEKWFRDLRWLLARELSKWPWEVDEMPAIEAFEGWEHLSGNPPTHVLVAAYLGVGKAGETEADAPELTPGDVEAWRGRKR